MGGSEVFFEEKFHTVSHRLHQSEKREVFLRTKQGQGNAHAVRSHTVLNDRRKAALKVNGNRHQRQHHHESQGDDLDEPQIDGSDIPIVGGRDSANGGVAHLLGVMLPVVEGDTMKFLGILNTDPAARAMPSANAAIARAGQRETGPRNKLYEVTDNLNSPRVRAGDLVELDPDWLTPPQGSLVMLELPGGAHVIQPYDPVDLIGKGIRVLATVVRGPPPYLP